jgi:hypothetical protein
MSLSLLLSKADISLCRPARVPAGAVSSGPEKNRSRFFAPSHFRTADRISFFLKCSRGMIA